MLTPWDLFPPADRWLSCFDLFSSACKTQEVLALLSLGLIAFGALPQFLKLVVNCCRSNPKNPLPSWSWTCLKTISILCLGVAIFASMTIPGDGSPPPPPQQFDVHGVPEASVIEATPQDISPSFFHFKSPPMLELYALVTPFVCWLSISVLTLFKTPFEGRSKADATLFLLLPLALVPLACLSLHARDLIALMMGAYIVLASVENWFQIVENLQNQSTGGLSSLSILAFGVEGLLAFGLSWVRLDSDSVRNGNPDILHPHASWTNAIVLVIQFMRAFSASILMCQDIVYSWKGNCQPQLPPSVERNAASNPVPRILISDESEPLMNQENLPSVAHANIFPSLSPQPSAPAFADIPRLTTRTPSPIQRPSSSVSASSQSMYPSVFSPHESAIPITAVASINRSDSDDEVPSIFARVYNSTKKRVSSITGHWNSPPAENFPEPIYASEITPLLGSRDPAPHCPSSTASTANPSYHDDHSGCCLFNSLVAIVQWLFLTAILTAMLLMIAVLGESLGWVSLLFFGFELFCWFVALAVAYHDDEAFEDHDVQARAESIQNQV